MLGDMLGQSIQSIRGNNVSHALQFLIQLPVAFHFQLTFTDGTEVALRYHLASL